jgi:hypothetical protein
MKTLAALARLAASSLVVASLAGCSNEQTNTQPTPPLTTEAGVPPPASPPRTVGHRNPFGDVLQADNLMADGDFELTGRNDQAPWIVFDSSGQTTLDYDTGGHCRSGIRCASTVAGQFLLGYIASPAQSDFVVRAYAKLDTARCGDALVIVIDLANQSTQTIIQPVAPTPDDSGWCSFMGTATNLAYQQPMLYFEIQSSKAKSMIVDQVSALPIEEAPAHKVTPPHVPSAVPAPTDKRIAFAREWIRTHRIFGRPPQRRGPIAP